MRQEKQVVLVTGAGSGVGRAGLGERLSAIDAANGAALDVSAVGQAAVDVLTMPRGQRPSRIVIDGQRKGTEAIDAVYHEKLAAFLRRMGWKT